MPTTSLSLLLFLFMTSVLAQTCVENCRVADLANSVCFWCNDGYLLANGQCNDCLPGYSKVGQECIEQVIPGGGIQPPTSDSQNDGNAGPCLIEIKGQCFECNSQYTLILGNCIVIPLPPPPPITAPETTPVTDPLTTPEPTTDNADNSNNDPSSNDGNGAAHSNSDCIIVTPGLPCQCQQGFYKSIQEGTCKPNNPLCNETLIFDYCKSCVQGYALTDAGRCIPDEGQSEPQTQPVTQAPTQPQTQPATQPVTQPATEPITPPFVVPPTTPATDPVTEPPTQPQTQPQVPATPELPPPVTQPICYGGYYYDASTNQCLLTDPLCNGTFDGWKCADCYLGYMLTADFKCVLDPQFAPPPTEPVSTVTAAPTQPDTTPANTNPPPVDIDPSTSGPSDYPEYWSEMLPYIFNVPYDSPNCATHRGGICFSCYERYYLNFDGCQAVDPHCYSWNSIGGYCTQCYLGYHPVHGQCKTNQQITQLESQGVAVDYSLVPQRACIFREVNINNECVRVSDLCETWSETTGQCITCYGGYDEVNGQCCMRSSIINGQCLQIFI